MSRECVSRDVMSQLRDNFKMAKRRSIPPEYATAFCERIKGARVAAGYKQERMAAALLIDRGTYKQYENRSVMPHDLIPEFCRRTDHHPWYILTGESSARSPGVHVLIQTINKEIDQHLPGHFVIHDGGPTYVDPRKQESGGRKSDNKVK